jgi:hypothetical protein
VRDCHVADEPSLSDHRYIYFKVRNLELGKIKFGNPKVTERETDNNDIKVNIEAAPRCICSVEDAELAVDWLQESIISSCHRNCPVRVAHSPKIVPLWKNSVTRPKIATSRYFNTAKGHGVNEMWNR